MICDKCGEDEMCNCVIDIKDADSGNWKTFHFCSRGCLARFLAEDTRDAE